MKTMHELFDGSEAQELGGATAENALSRAEAPILIGDVVEADCAELRDMAVWFESRGKPMQGEFLRKVADRHEVIFGAYWTATTKESSVVA